MNCPFCGANAIPGYSKPRFKCWTYFPEKSGTDPIRSNTCYERQLFQQADQLNEVLLKDRGKTNEINLLTKENRDLRQRLGEAEGLLREMEENGNCSNSFFINWITRVKEYFPLEGKMVNSSFKVKFNPNEPTVTVSQLSQQADLMEKAMDFLFRIIAEELCLCNADSKNCVIEEARRYIKEWEEKHGKP